MSRRVKTAFFLALILIPTSLHAAFEVENILTADIDGPVLDVTTNPNGDVAFVLTPGGGVDLFNRRSGRARSHPG